MTKTPGEFDRPKPITKAEREARKAFRQVDAEKAMTEHEIAQKKFQTNRERLKAERLTREASATGSQRQKPSPRRRGNDGTLDMMITVSELESIIAQATAGEQVQYEGKPIGAVEQVTTKLTELKLKRSADPDYLIFVGIDRFGECFFAAFSTMGDPREFRARHDKQLDRAAEGLLPAGMSPRPT